MSGTGVTAVVLASRGGPRLARALDSVAWAEARAVLDPARRLAAEPLPAGVSHDVAEPAPATAWLLLLHEGEVVPVALADAIRTVLARPSPAPAFRIPVELRAFGTRLRLRGAPIRLACAAGARLRLGSTLEIALEGLGERPARLAVPLVARGAGSLAEAVDDLDGDGAALAALLRGRHRRTHVRHLLLAPLGAAGRVLCAGGRSRIRWGRWALAVLAGYRTMVAYAKLWELHHVEGGE